MSEYRHKKTPEGCLPSGARCAVGIRQVSRPSGLPLGGVQMNDALEVEALGYDLGVSHLALDPATVHWTTSFPACGECRDASGGVSRERAQVMAPEDAEDTITGGSRL